MPFVAGAKLLLGSAVYGEERPTTDLYRFQLYFRFVAQSDIPRVKSPVSATDRPSDFNNANVPGVLVPSCLYRS